MGKGPGADEGLQLTEGGLGLRLGAQEGFDGSGQTGRVYRQQNQAIAVVKSETE